MTEETTTEQLAEIDRDMANTIQVCEGRWRTRGGRICNVTPTPAHDGRAAGYPWWDSAYQATWTQNGRYHSNCEESKLDLIEYLGPIEPDKTQELPDKTQELETKTQDLPEYTPPEGWRVVRFGEQLLPGDMWVNEDGTEQRSAILHWDAAAVSGGRCIRRIKPEPQAKPEPEPQPQPVPVQVREGRWRTRDGNIRNVTPTPAHDSRAKRWPWRDAKYDQTFREDGRQYIIEESPSDLVEYLGPIEAEPEPQPDSELQAQVAFLKGREVTLGTRLQQEREITTRLRGELESVQNLLGTERQRVTQLEELVTSLRTINRGCENAVREAGNMNTALRNQLAAVKAELVTQAETSRRLQIELDAAQQVPADSPELRQLRADLAEVTRERDQHLDSYQRIFGDLETIRETTKAAAVEAIAEWLQPIRAVDNPNLANETLQHLPQIMRHLTGLDSHAID